MKSKQKAHTHRTEMNVCYCLLRSIYIYTVCLQCLTSTTDTNTFQYKPNIAKHETIKDDLCENEQETEKTKILVFTSFQFAGKTSNIVYPTRLPAHGNTAYTFIASSINLSTKERTLYSIIKYTRRNDCGWLTAIRYRRLGVQMHVQSIIYNIYIITDSSHYYCDSDVRC